MLLLWFVRFLLEAEILEEGLAAVIEKSTVVWYVLPLHTVVIVMMWAVSQSGVDR